MRSCTSPGRHDIFSPVSSAAFSFKWMTLVARASLLRLHRIIGLAMAALLLVQALSGAMLLYRGPLARWIDPVGLTSPGIGPEISPGEAVARANRSVPGFMVTRLFAPDSPNATYLAQLGNAEGTTRYASVDAAGGSVLRSGSVLAFPVEAALQIHYRLMAGKAGMAIIVLNGLALLAMAGSGLAFWWPRRGGWRKALAVGSTLSPRLVLRQCHRTAGAILAVILLFMAFTGLLLAVPDFLAADTATAPPKASAVAIDRSLALAQSAFPDAMLRDLRLGGDRMIVNFRAPERNVRAVHRAIVTLAQPHIVNAKRAENNKALWITILPLHGGDSFGPVGPVLLLFTAVVLVALTVSGPFMWWQAAALRHRSASRRPAR